MLHDQLLAIVDSKKLSMLSGSRASRVIDSLTNTSLHQRANTTVTSSRPQVFHEPPVREPDPLTYPLHHKPSQEAQAWRKRLDLNRSKQLGDPRAGQRFGGQRQIRDRGTSRAVTPRFRIHRSTPGRSGPGTSRKRTRHAPLLHCSAEPKARHASPH